MASMPLNSPLPMTSSFMKLPCHLRSREAVIYETGAAFMASTMLGTFGKIHLQNLKAHSSLATVENLECAPQTTGIKTQARKDVTMAKEALLYSEAEQTVAAAMHALDLAKAAVKAARDAMDLSESQNLVTGEHDNDHSLEEEFLKFKKMNFANNPLGTVEALLEGEQTTNEIHVYDNQLWLSDLINSEKNWAKENNLDFSSDNLKDGFEVSVKSRRQKERQARREKASEKAAIAASKDLPEKKRRNSTKNQSNRRLLTANEEISFSRKVQDLHKLEKIKQQYKDKMGKEPTVNQWAEAVGIDQKALRKRLEEGYESRSKMVSCNLRLVVSIATKYQNMGIGLQDLVQAGCVGLVRGIEKFDGTRGFRFSTYAHWWIRQAINKTLTSQSKLVGVPANAVEAASQLRDTKTLFVEKHHRSPTLQELSDITGFSKTRIKDVMSYRKTFVSLDSPAPGKDEAYLASVVDDPDQLSVDTITSEELGQRDIDNVLQTLTPKERDLLRLRYGLDDGVLRTLQEVGEHFSLSRERVRQMERTAMRKLRENQDIRDLEHYLAI